ncbi:Fut1_Fut2_like domain containing protein [Candidatus Pelagibacterales bacterium]
MINKKKLCVEISENLGNQMFMYAHAYALSKKLNRKLYIDNESAYLTKKSVGSYKLDRFNISSKIIENQYKFLSTFQYLKKKYISKLDYFKKNKIFYKEKLGVDKKTHYYNEQDLDKNKNSLIYIRGHFESEKYFLNYKESILREFSFKNKKQYQNNSYYKYILNNNIVAITIRQNRFNERNHSQTTDLLLKNKSDTFLIKQIKYIKKSVSYFKNKVKNPKFLIWSNDFSNLDKYFSNNFIFVKNHNKNKDLTDLYLLTHCKYFIVSPSTFSWWGAWLSKRKGKICVRPKNLNVSNNKDFWPKEWKSIL